jgi:serine/threonine-protein kinase HipA
MTVKHSELAVFAHIDGQWTPCGQLTLGENDINLVSSTFEYHDSYRHSANAVDVDPVSLGFGATMGASGSRLEPKGGLPFFGAFRDATPDSWGRRVIESKLDAPINGLPESTYMLHAGSERVGLLDIRRNATDAPTEPRDDWSNLANLVHAASRVDDGLPISDKRCDLFVQGTGLGGARPKASVRDEHGILWLAKFSSRGDRFDIPAVECASLRMAGQAGLRIPTVKTTTLDGRRVMLIRRFDRYWKVPCSEALDESERLTSRPGGGRQEHRSGFVSALTLVGCDESQSRDMAYSHVAAAMAVYCHAASVRRDMHELFKRMVFNIFTSNDDDHLRNHAFCWDEHSRGWKLSPLYDVLPRPSLASERFLHLGVGAQGRLATLDNALTRHEAFCLSKQAAAEVISEVWAIVRDWRRHFDASGVGERDMETVASAFRSIDDIASVNLRRKLP